MTNQRFSRTNFADLDPNTPGLHILVESGIPEDASATLEFHNDEPDDVLATALEAVELEPEDLESDDEETASNAAAVIIGRRTDLDSECAWLGVCPDGRVVLFVGSTGDPTVVADPVLVNTAIARFVECMAHYNAFMLAIDPLQDLPDDEAAWRTAFLDVSDAIVRIDPEASRRDAHWLPLINESNGLTYDEEHAGLATELINLVLDAKRRHGA